MNILNIKNLSKKYGDREILKDISFDINKGEIVSILGTSGCGKSTLLNIISGLEKESAGKIKYYKDDMVISYMFQSDTLLPWLNVLDNALLGLKLKKECTPKNKEYTKELLIKYGLGDYIEKNINELSGGMKQRVG